MSTAEPSAFTDAELASLFSGLELYSALVLAVSGGPDSTALMVLAARWRAARKSGPKLIAVTVDHGLRKEARAEAAAVGKLARKLGLAHRTLRWTGRKPKTGLQQAARMARYRLLAEAAREAGAGAVLTAHTLDDQAETVLIRMTRGSGLRGLGAMEKVSPLPTTLRAPSAATTPSFRGASGASEPGIHGGGALDSGCGAARRPGMTALVRPLLGIPKTRLLASLAAAKVPYAQDPSNRDPRFTRARLRALMPELAREGLDAARFAALARRLRRADAAIEAAVQEAAARLTVKSFGQGAVTFDAEGYARLPAEVGLRLIGSAIDRVGDEGPVELAKLEALKDAFDEAQAASHARFRRSLAGAIVTLKGHRIVVERAPPRRRRPLTKGRHGGADRGKSR